MSIQFHQQNSIALRDEQSSTTLPVMIQRAAHQLASAVSAAEVLDARDMASVAYDAAKKAARLARAKGAHDELIAKAHRAQADALEIEAAAKRRLADEYDAAQERGEVRTAGKPNSSNAEEFGAADIGLTHKDIHEARQIRDAEEAEPGIVRKTIDEQLEAGQEPTKAAVRKAIEAVNKETEKMDVAVIEPQQTRTGPRINFPENITPEELARQGMALEDAGETAEAVAKKFGIGTHSYRKLCDIIFLLDRGNYTQADSAIVERAVAMVNETHRVVDAWELLSPVAAKVWGENVSTVARSNREETRVDRFEHVFGIIEQTCASAAQMDVPYLTEEAAKAAVKEIKAARQNLQILLNRIEEIHA
jgi:hypothetical protein